MGHLVGEGPLLPQALPLLSASFFLAGGWGQTSQESELRCPEPRVGHLSYSLP